MDRKDLLQTRLRELDQEIRSFDLKKDICLVAVTKYSQFEDIELSYKVGHRDFGENRVQDLFDKAALAFEKRMNEINWHFIGHLQSNKISKLFVIPNLKTIHSVHSQKLLEALYSKASLLEGRSIGYFLQVNTSLEDEKSGFENYDELAHAVNYCLKHDGGPLKLMGLMTMGKIRTENVRADAKISFDKLVQLKKHLESDFSVDLKLSMGMSGDYDVALACGSDYIRVGSKIFSGS